MAGQDAIGITDMDKLYYSIGDVAEILGENVSLVRFWSDSFPKFIRPRRNAKGNRLFTAADVEMFKRIHFLVKNEGLTLEGAAKRLARDTAKVDRTIRVLESLRRIREQLDGIRKGQ